MIELLECAQAGDAKALDEGRPLLERTSIWSHVGDLSRRVQDSWIESMTGDDRLTREAFKRRADEMCRDLLASGDSPLERLLIERIVATWLQVCHADLAYGNLLKGVSHSFAQGTYAQKRQDAANARHLKAVRALATVRRLLVPAVQVNIARQQIISQGMPAKASDGAA